MKNRPKRIARITATSENRGKSRAMTSRLNANIARKSIASRFCGVRNRSTLSDVRGLIAQVVVVLIRYLESTAVLSGLVGSCVRSWMIDIPNAQIRATMAVGYRKITLGHMKIRIPGPRCAPAGTGVEDEGADFASVDMRGKLRAEKSSRVFRLHRPSSHAERVPNREGEGILTPWQSWVKYLKAWRLAKTAGRRDRRARASLTTKMFAAAAQTLKATTSITGRSTAHSPRPFASTLLEMKRAAGSRAPG